MMSLTLFVRLGEAKCAAVLVLHALDFLLQARYFGISVVQLLFEIANRVLLRERDSNI